MIVYLFDRHAVCQYLRVGTLLKYYALNILTQCKIVYSFMSFLKSVLSYQTGTKEKETHCIQLQLSKLTCAHLIHVCEHFKTSVTFYVLVHKLF